MEFAATRSAMVDFLGYTIVRDVPVSEQEARLWNAPSLEGRQCSLLQPASGADVFIRLVETMETPGYAPLLHFGWNAAELHVQDVFGLAKKLEDSPFRIIGGPRDLLDNDAVIAMQVLGPGNELLYLTQINHAGMQATYGKAESAVDRIFIAVLGSSNPTASSRFYEPMATRLTQRKAFNIQVLARAHGLDPLASRFDISSAVFSDKFRIEMDAYPAAASPKPRRPGELMPGLSILTVTAPEELRDQLETLCPAGRGPATAPYHGREVFLLRGPDEEQLEVIIAR